MHSALRPMLFLAAGLGLSVSGCVAPRSIAHSGRVTPSGEYRPGAEMVFNVPTGTTGAILTGVKDTVGNLVTKQDDLYEDGINAASKAAIGYSLDPLTYGMAFGLRYGVIERVDAGYKYALGAHTLDARFQFLGAPGARAKEGPGESLDSSWAASVGAQVSRQKFELPGFAGLEKLGSLFGFHMTRNDLLVPVVVSYPFGPDEKYGAVSFGLVGGYTWLEYGLNPKNLVKDVGGVQEVVEKVTRKKGYATYGAFFNVKGGYRFGYVGLGMAVYYQNYGRFELFDNVDVKLSGVTFVPMLSLELRY